MNPYLDYEKPNPGSDEARSQGCLCPQEDNAFGKGIMGLGCSFWVRQDCPVHGKAKDAAIVAAREGHDD